MQKFNNYLNFFTEFDMWDQVFPGSNINTNTIDSDNFIVNIANLFKNESINRLDVKLVQNYKIESPTAKKIVFLITLLSLSPENSLEIFKKKEQCFMDDETIVEWLRVLNINDDIFKAFLKYKPTTSSEELMAKGIVGRELGIEIKRLEIENFKKLLQLIKNPN